MSSNRVHDVWKEPVYIQLWLRAFQFEREAHIRPRFPINLGYFGSGDRTQLRARVFEDEISERAANYKVAET